MRKRGITIAFRSPEDIVDFLQLSRPVSHAYSRFLVDIPCPLSPSHVVAQVPTQVVDLLDCYKDDILELKLWYQPQIQPALPAEETVENAVQEQIAISNENEDGFELPVTLKELHTLHLLSNYVHPNSNTAGGAQQQHQMPKYFSHLETPNLRSLSIQHLYDTECTATVRKLIATSKLPLESFKIPAKPFPAVALGLSQLENLCELDLLGIFNGFSCATNDTLNAIIRWCPNLKKLGIEFSFRATLDKIQELLEKLADSLVEFKCTIQDRNLLARQIVRVDFIFPQMSKLKTLQMRWSNPGLVYYIDRLPVLQELLLDSVWTRKVQGSIFPGGQAFEEGMSQYTTLTSLKLAEVVSMEQVQVLSNYFPNLQVLGCSFASNEALRLVYEKMGGLKWLIIERKSNVTEAGGICGVSDEELMAKQAAEDNVGKEAFIRNVPYIANLQKLESLELCQLGISWWSIQFAIVDLPKLNTLVVQVKLKIKISILMYRNS